MPTDRYLTLASESEGIYREKASKFIAYAFPIGDEEAFTLRCATIAKEHHTCRHVCYAWVLGEQGERYRSNDAGEPAGTAGKPLLRQLQGANITFAGIVVVRYFGGTLLGKGGLVHAYAEAAREALAKNTIIEKVLRSTIHIACPYSIVEAIKNDVIKSGGEVLNAEYGEPCVLMVTVARDRSIAFSEKWILAGARVGAVQAK